MVFLSPEFHIGVDAQQVLNMIVVIAGNAVVDIAVDDDAVEEGEEADDVVVFAVEILLSAEAQFWLVGEVFYHQF